VFKYYFTSLTHLEGTVTCTTTAAAAAAAAATYNEQRSRHGRFDSKIFESANHFRIESNRTADSNSNRMSKLRRCLTNTTCFLNLKISRSINFKTVSSKFPCSPLRTAVAYTSACCYGDAVIASRCIECWS